MVVANAKILNRLDMTVGPEIVSKQLPHIHGVVNPYIMAF